MLGPRSPKGPFTARTTPITDNSTLSPLLGKYRRTYAGTLIRRQSDWLILGMMDAAPNSWAMFAMTATKPEGPYSAAAIGAQRRVRSLPPAADGGISRLRPCGIRRCAGTSVALNRNFQGIFRAPLERATEAGAWEIFRHGSFWHAEDVEHEAYGLWGQTPACRVDSAETLWTMFNSRDSKGMGTVSLAQRPWNQPLRPSGFVLSGHEGPSLTCLRQTFRSFQLQAKLRVRGTSRLFWDFHAPLGPNKPQSDSTLHPLTRTRHQAVEVSGTKWKVVSVDTHGQAITLASGSIAHCPHWLLSLHRKPDGNTTLTSNGQVLWTAVRSQTPMSCRGRLACWQNRIATSSVDQFRIAGEPVEGSMAYLFTEALLGAGEKPADWQERRQSDFRYGVGVVSRRRDARVKWNVVGRP